ncbi:hypothetical protein GBAR_LOCUS3408, partial [Geodia barretti]
MRRLQMLKWGWGVSGSDLVKDFQKLLLNQPVSQPVSLDVTVSLCEAPEHCQCQTFQWPSEEERNRSHISTKYAHPPLCHVEAHDHLTFVLP